MAAAFHSNGSTNKSEFLSRIARADKAAAQECIDVYGATVWALAKQSTDSNEAAEKAVQEIFTDIWDNAAFCDLNIADEENWIVMIARRRLSEYSATAVYQTPLIPASRISPNQHNEAGTSESVSV